MLKDKDQIMKQYRYYLKEQETLYTDFNVSFAKFLLHLPCPMSYEVWKYLHKVVGDSE